MRIVLVGLLLLSSFAVGQDKDLYATNALASLLQATGWAPNSIPADAIVRGNFVRTADGQEQLSPATYKIKGIRLFKVEMDGGSATTFNEGRGATTKSDGRKALSPYSKATMRPVVLPFFSEIPSLISGDFKVAFKGTGTSIKEPCTQVHVEPNLSTVADPSGNLRYAGSMTLCISDASGLLLQAEFVRAMDTSPSALLPYVVRYSDYRKVGALLVPFEHELLISGRSILKFRASGVELNVGLPDDEFAIPNASEVR